MESREPNVRQELDKLFDCLRVTEEKLNCALEAVNGHELAEACEGGAPCDGNRREPGILDRLGLVVKRASVVADKAAKLASQL